MFKTLNLATLQRAVTALKRRGIEANAQTLGIVVVAAEVVGVPFTAVEEGRRRIARAQSKAAKARDKAGKTRQSTDKRIGDERSASASETRRLERQIVREENRVARRVRNVRAKGQRKIDGCTAKAATADREAGTVQDLLALLQG
ncbi:MAG: hypothetical protein HY475_01325 [Candidatus Terrybacteria bacterium]|nr:hypothetical protein [Candidatus Terrybacteria bacterium]